MVWDFERHLLSINDWRCRESLGFAFFETKKLTAPLCGSTLAYLSIPLWAMEPLIGLIQIYPTTVLLMAVSFLTVWGIGAAVMWRSRYALAGYEGARWAMVLARVVVLVAVLWFPYGKSAVLVSPALAVLGVIFFTVGLYGRVPPDPDGAD